MLYHCSNTSSTMLCWNLVHLGVVFGHVSAILRSWSVHICLLLSCISMSVHAECNIKYQFCLSVNFSVQCRCCVKTNRHIVTLFWHSGRGIILVFPAPPVLQNSKRKHSTGAFNTRRWKILQISPFISEMVWDSTLLTM